MPLKPRRPLALAGLGLCAASAALACLMVGGCVPSVPQPAPAPPPPAATPAPPPPAPPPIAVEVPTPTYENWMDAPQNPGDWHYRRAGTTTRASFAAPGESPLFELVCEGGGQVALLRRGEGAQALRVLTESVERTLPATSRAGAIAALLPARDPLLDAMAFSKGRFGVSVQGLPTLYLPAWPEVTRVIEDCR